MHVYEGHLEGSVSQIFYLGPSFYFIQPRDISEIDLSIVDLWTKLIYFFIT